MNISIKQATQDDLAVILDILTEAEEWVEEKGEPLWELDELQPETIKEDIRKGEFFIAYADHEAAGVFKFQTEDQLFWSDVPEGESTYIHRLAVKRKFSGGTISSAMINDAKMKTKEMGRRFLRLDCDVSRPKLHTLYKKHGFMEHSNRQVGPYYVTRYQYEIKS
ncbi:GNAT family N-acetyltransferase [bacterium]|nr:GNAT family N-acetyltransferase [bacterium]RQV95286.1 MAG: GNAT family N-acetyltransferase [bacterium]